MTQFNWRKSTYSGPNSDDCVEVADLPVAGKAVRDSKKPKWSDPDVHRHRMGHLRSQHQVRRTRLSAPRTARQAPD